MKVFNFFAITIYSAIAFDFALETSGDDVDQESPVYEGSGETTPAPTSRVSSSQTPTTSTTTTTTTTAEQTSKPTTQITTTTTTSKPTTTTTQPPGPLKCSTCNVDEIGPYALKAGSGGCIRTRGNPNYAYYTSVHYNCQCLIKDGNDYTFDDKNEYESCHFMHYNVPATDAPQTWAVATWFILLVVTGKDPLKNSFLEFF